ncbi:MAG: MMPL family transporter [Maritimibacter sp.]|nr:MMPL family transporter [Maritimibacter sp.]
MTTWRRGLMGTLRALEARLWLLWAAVGLVALVAVTGIARLEFDDGLIRFFDSDLDAFEDYAAVSRAFEGDTNDVIVLVEADDIAAPEVAAALSDFVLDAQFVPGVRAVISPLSLRLPAEPGEAGEAPLFPYPPLAQDAMAARLDRAFASLPALTGLMAADRSALIAVLPITETDRDDTENRRAQLDAIDTLAARVTEASGATLSLSGYPVLRDTVARALIRDIVVLNAIGVLVGFLVASVAFRSVRLALITLPAPMLGTALAVGLHGHLGVTINTITIALPVLVLVLATSDAIHIGFERARQGARNPVRAAMRATRRVATACLFAAVTTAIAFAALAWSRSEIIAEMGRMGLLVTVVSTLTVLLTHTAVLATVGRQRWFAPVFARLAHRPPSILGLTRLPALAFAAPRTLAWGGLALALVATALYSQAGPRYSLLDSLYDDNPVREVFARVEAKVAPVSQVLVPVAATDPEAVARVAAHVAAATGTEAVRSIANIAGGAEGATETLPEALARRMVSRDGATTLVSAPFRYENGEQAMALADGLDAAIAADPALDGIDIGRATGLPIMSARVAGAVLDEINRGLVVALLGVGLLILVWLGSLRLALVSLLPNILPVTLIGAFLTLSGRGIEFSNALALTVAFGIAVDDTLHVLNRLKLSGGLERITRARLEEALAEVAPALVTTSAVLVLGMGGALFAENKGVADFGKIAMAVYALALVADLVVLPAALARFGPRGYLRDRQE